MTRKKSSKKKSNQKSSYKVRNWPEYNKSLKQRGSVTIWLTPEAIENWNYNGPTQRGAQFTYSDLAIEAILILKIVFAFEFRQIEGLMRSLFELMKIDLDVPDYTTLSRRQKRLTISLPVRRRDEPLHLVVDSTGVKIFGEGEWKVRQHGYSKRRTWRKLHLAVDEATGEIQAAELTANPVDDAEEMKPLLEQTQNAIGTVSGDGAYDQQKVYVALAERAKQQNQPIQVNIPPSKNAKIVQHGNSSRPPFVRDQNLRLIRREGRQQWKRNSGYHRRSIAENAMYRYKTIIGPALKARAFDAQKVEALLGCTILNKMAAMGMPQAYQIQ